MEDQVVTAADAAAGTVPIEQTFFLSLIDTMTPTTYALAYVMVALFLVHGLVLGVFLLNAFFDASLTTVAERRRSLWRTLGGVLSLQILIGVILVILLFTNRGAA